MDLLTRAVLDNVGWCARVCPGGTDPVTGIWRTHRTPAPLFPDAVTLRTGVSAADLAAALVDRSACSVKDSFGDVDLTPHGFRMLFTGSWIGREPDPVTASPGWSVVTDEAGLARWCSAAGLPEVLPARLLDEPSVRVLSGPGGGAVATVTGPVVGVSNVVGDAVWEQLPAALARHHPGLPVVGYEHGADLDAALAAGFTELGPVRVWLRA